MKRPLSHRLLFWPIWFLGWVLVTVLGPVWVRGFGRVPKKGPVLILANHQSLSDPIILQVACRRHIVFLANHDLFSMGLLTRFVKWWGAIPIAPNTPDRKALKEAAEVLKAGGAVCIFPEGGLSDDSTIKPLLPGVTLLARLGDHPTIICCGLRNTRYMVPYESRILRPAFRRIDARWGERKSASDFSDADSFIAWAQAELDRLTEPQP